MGRKKKSDFKNRGRHVWSLTKRCRNTELFFLELRTEMDDIYIFPSQPYTQSTAQSKAKEWKNPPYTQTQTQLNPSYSLTLLYHLFSFALTPANKVLTQNKHDSCPKTKSKNVVKLKTRKLIWVATVAVCSGRGAVTHVLWGRACSGSSLRSHNDTPLSSSLSSLAVAT